MGETLTTGRSDIDDADGLSNVACTYRWLANNPDISGGTGASYILMNAEEGKAIKVRVSFTDDRSHQETLTGEAAAVTPAAEESLMWSATLTAGGYSDFTGYSEFTNTGETGELSLKEFTLDSSDFSVQMPGEKDGTWFHLGLNQAISGNFTLQVGETLFASGGATIHGGYVTCTCGRSGRRPCRLGTPWMSA